MFFKKSIRKRIQKGIVALDKIRPDWHWRINLSELDMKYSDACVLGLIFGDYNKLRLKGKSIDEFYKWAYKNGFSPLCQAGKYDLAWLFPLTIRKHNKLWKEAVENKRYAERKAMSLDLPYYSNYVEKTRQ